MAEQRHGLGDFGLPAGGRLRGERERARQEKDKSEEALHRDSINPWVLCVGREDSGRILLWSQRAMEFERFLKPADASRAMRMLRKLSAHDISGWALTGGMAIEIHLLLRGPASVTRPLRDIDFVTRSFEDIPGKLGDELLFRHVHPFVPPGKMLLQAVEGEMAVRVDVMRAHTTQMDRLMPIELGGIPLRMVSLEYIEALHAVQCWDLMEDKKTDPKYARDFMRILDLVEADEVEAIWQEHKKPECPESFAEAARELRHAVASKPELLLPVVRVIDVNAVCPRCYGTETFRLADASRIVSILGYC
jgi:hypothetical protein